MKNNANLIFVCGPGRSGTTAMAKLLNRHPKICIGIERYNRKFTRDKEFDKDCFSRKRFFDFRSSDTGSWQLPQNSTWSRELYEKLEKKWEKANYYGDKIPSLFRFFDEVSTAYPGCRFIFMLRHISGIASSWNARVLDPEDPWYRKRDYKMALAMWNEALSSVSDSMSKDGIQIHLVNYERFFSGIPGDLSSLLRFLDLDDDDAFRKAYRKSCSYYQERVANKAQIILEGQVEYIKENADFTSYDRLCGHTS